LRTLANDGRRGKELSMTDYTATDPAQEARFTAFVAECDRLIQQAAGHSHVVDFLNTLDLDATRALRGYAVRADAAGLVELIDATWAAR
jgi:hypothetical protein